MRSLQAIYRTDGKRWCVDIVDKETQEPIEGVYMWAVRPPRSDLPIGFMGSIEAKILINDIIVAPFLPENTSKE